MATFAPLTRKSQTGKAPQPIVPKKPPPPKIESRPRVPERRPELPPFAMRGGSALVQAKLRVSQPGDASEVEADAAAERLTAGLPAPVGPAPADADPNQQPDESTASEQKVLTTSAEVASAGTAAGDESAFARRSAAGPRFVGANTQAQLRNSAGRGAPLEESDRASFEAGLGHDLDGVRVHRDAEAARITADAGAVALTHGRDIYFSPGAYAPRTPSGARLLAHEIAHVAQQAQRAPAVQRQAAPAPAAEQVRKFKVHFPKGAQLDGAEAGALTLTQAFGVTLAQARQLLVRHHAQWAETFTLTKRDREQGFFNVDMSEGLYDEVRDELAGMREEAKRTKDFGKLPKSEQQKVNDEADKQFWKEIDDKTNEKIDPKKGAAEQQKAEQWKMIRDQLLQLREILGALPPAVRSVMGDPSRFTPTQYEQLVRIGTKLKGLNADDLELYKIIATATTIDLDAVETSLDQFISFKEKYRQALQTNTAPPASSGGDKPAPAAGDQAELPLDKQLERSWEGFDKAGFGKMDAASKEATARQIAAQRTATQIRYMTTHPGETAVNMAKGLNPAELAQGIEKDVKEFKGSESSWGKWAAGTGIGGKTAGWIAGVAAVAWVVMWFIPGVNLANAMATALAVAMYAGLASVVLAGASSELHIQAAAASKTEGEFEKQTNAAADELTSFVLGAALLAAAFVLKFLGRVKFVQRYLNIGKVLNDAKVKAWNAVGVDALRAVRQEAVAAIQSQVAALDAEIQPAQAEHLALRKQIEALSPADLMRKIATDPAFASQLGLDPQQAKAFGPAAEGPLAEQGAPKAKAKILEAMDDAAAEAKARIDRFKGDVQKSIDDLTGADDKSSFDSAVNRAQKTLAPEEQARVSDEAGKAYQDRKLKAALEELEKQAAKAKADAAAAKAKVDADAAKAEADTATKAKTGTAAQPATAGVKPKPPEAGAQPAEKKPGTSTKDATPAADAYLEAGKKLGLSDSTVDQLRKANVEMTRVADLIKKGNAPEIAADLAVRELDLAKTFEAVKVAKGKEATRLARLAADGGIMSRVEQLMDYARKGLYGNPRKLPQLITAIGKGSLQHIQAIDDGLSRLGQGHTVDIEAEADIVDHTTQEAIQHKQVSGKAAEALGDNVKSALKQLAGKSDPKEIPPPGFKRIADIRIIEPTNPNFAADEATLSRYLKEMKALSEKIGTDPDADPNARMEGLDGNLQVRITNSKGTFKFDGPDFDPVK